MVKGKVKSEEWKIQWFKWRVKSEESNGLSEDAARKECWAKPNQNSCSRFAQSILCPSSHVLMFSCLSKKHVLLSSQNHVLLFSCLSPKTMFFCSHVFPKIMFFCSHVFPPKPCSSVLMSPQKNMFFCLTPLAWYGSETVPPTLSVNKTH